MVVSRDVQRAQATIDAALLPQARINAHAVKAGSRKPE